MRRYYFDLSGREADQTGEMFETHEDARNAAVKFLGEYLAHNPDFASANQWRVDVRDETRMLVLHVVVATVAGPRTLRAVPA